MRDAFTAILCTVMIAAGWYYLTRSQGVQRLQALESPRRNATRRKARRMGAWSLIAVGIGWFWLMWELQRHTSDVRFLLAALVVAVALTTMLITVMVDVYLTMRIRRSNGGPK